MDGTSYGSGSASLFASAARAVCACFEKVGDNDKCPIHGKALRTKRDITPQEMFDAYKHEPELSAVVDVEGFEKRDCIEIRGFEDRRIAIIHPRFPNWWAKEFNRLVEVGHAG